MNRICDNIPVTASAHGMWTIRVNVFATDQWVEMICVRCWVRQGAGVGSGRLLS